MGPRTVTHSTFVIERGLNAAPERVFDAFRDPAKKRRWFAEGEGFEVNEYELDFRVGGTERARFVGTGKSPVKGVAMANDTTYQDIVPDSRVVFAYTMTVGGQRISASLASVELFPEGSGTGMIYTEQAAFFEGADGAEIREAGWRQLLHGLERELER